MFKWSYGALLILLATPVIGVAADFYLYFERCKITVGYLILSNESLKTFDGDGSLTACTRISQTIRCDFEFPGGDSKGYRNSDVYKVDIETPPLLIFTNANMSDYYVVDLSQHAVTLITRVMDRKFAGAKVCQGTYMTESERKQLDKTKQK